MPWTKVFLDPADLAPFSNDGGIRVASYVDALREAQEQLLGSDDRVILMGEGIDDPGGVFGSTRGLAGRFGSRRVMDLPIAENGMTGVAVGAAAAGMRPIFVHMRMDFLPMCMDQIVNHAAKWHYMSGGQVPVPLVIRSIIGRGWGSAAQHSQSLYGLFRSVPGLKVVVPATPYDAKGLLIQAVQDGNPVMCVEHRWIYDAMGPVPEEMYSVPFGQGLIRRKGTQVTVVALSQMLYEAVKAANVLQERGVSIEIIDPRTIAPLDTELITDSVRRTGRLLVAEPSCHRSGIAAEIAWRILETDPGLLKAPVRRIGFADTPTPCSPVLEAAYYPDSGDIVEAVLEML